MKYLKIYFFMVTICIFYLNMSYSQINNKMNIRVSFNGKFQSESLRSEQKSGSANGKYWCNYQIGRVSNEIRQLKNFTFYEDEQSLYSFPVAHGSDLYISNCGITAFVDMTEHYKQKITVRFYSKTGLELFCTSFYNAIQFGFSPKGKIFVVGTTNETNLIYIKENKIEKYEKGYQFDVSENEQLLAIASKSKVKIYFSGKLINEFTTGFLHTRNIKISNTANILAVIDKKNLKIYSLKKNTLLFTSRLCGKKSYRDLLIKNNQIYTGIHFRNNGISKGILRSQDLKGNILIEREESCKKYNNYEKYKNTKHTAKDYPQIPWPFFPFDSMHTVWNHYEQHMGGYGSDFSYLHQGLDIITPIAEPVYSVSEGYVKCVLTLGGAIYWRIAISDENTVDYSNGWLYAHLIESSIQFDVGDTVYIHDYIGDIIEWYDDWGHIHFAEIRDEGRVWFYDDNEWGITYNPVLSLMPNSDSISPVIDDVFPDQKLAFCLNETSTYLEPDSLYGDIDIITKIVDYHGDSPWQQPAYSIYYKIKKLPDGVTIFPRTLAHVLNHSYNFYSAGNYEPYATVIYKRDELLYPSSWMDMERRFHHILTNSNGDSTVALSEKNLAFRTSDYPDGDYRIIIEAYDENGNMGTDSMDVHFLNHVNNISENDFHMNNEFLLMQNYPNPFNPETTIAFYLEKNSMVTLFIYNAMGQKINTLIQKTMSAGTNTIKWNGKDMEGHLIGSGIYFYQLKISDFSQTKKMILVR